MAAYPTSPVHRTISQRVNQHTTFRMEDGKPRGINWTAKKAYRLRLIHSPITQAQLVTLESFYDTNRDALNTVDYLGTTYNFRFRQGGYAVEDRNSDYLTASIIVDAYL